MTSQVLLSDFVQIDLKLGEKIAKFRKLSGLSQEGLAQRIGKTRSSVAAYENNIAEPTLSIIVEIAKALGISVYDFVHEIDKEAGTLKGTELTHTEELKMQVLKLKLELEAIRRELNDKNKIIALYEEKKGEMDEKYRQIEGLYEKINKMLS